MGNPGLRTNPAPLELWRFGVTGGDRGVDLGPENVDVIALPKGNNPQGEWSVGTFTARKLVLQDDAVPRTDAIRDVRKVHASPSELAPEEHASRLSRPHESE
jgi:hypothetical protein